MSFRSDNAPVRFDRADYDTCSHLLVCIIVGDQQLRQMVVIGDADEPLIIAAKLHGLATWIEEKATE